MKTIYVGNLPFKTTEQDIMDLFERHGEVHSIKIVYDHETTRSRGFCFVEMDDGEADAAIEAVHGAELNGRKLKVNAARMRKNRHPFRSW